MKPTRDELLNHEADGIREFDNALPKWWLYGFYFTMAFAVIYLVNYHVLPKPVVGWPTLAIEYQADLTEARRLGPSPNAQPPGAGAAVMIVALTDHESLEKGRAIFEGPDNTCFACHRADLGGLVGPNLTDQYWLHGCTPADLGHDISTGFPDKGMLPFGTNKKLTDAQLTQLVSYILSKRGSNPANPKAIDAARDKACGG